MKFKPTQDRLILKLFPPEANISEGGIFIPDTVKDDAALIYGEILEVGPGRTMPDGTFIPMQFKVGQKVLLARMKVLVLKKPSSLSPSPTVLTDSEEVVAVIE